MHSPPMEGNFCNQHGKAGNRSKYKTTKDADYVEMSNCITTSYSISKQAWKWTKKLFFCILDHTILNSFIIFASCGSKLSTRNSD
jgi:hypothetical protein